MMPVHINVTFGNMEYAVLENTNTLRYLNKRYRTKWLEHLFFQNYSVKNGCISSYALIKTQ